MGELYERERRENEVFHSGGYGSGGFGGCLYQRQHGEEPDGTDRGCPAVLPWIPYHEKSGGLSAPITLIGDGWNGAGYGEPSGSDGF